MYDKRIPSFKTEARDQTLGFKFWKIIQAIIGPLVVALITFLAWDRDRAWNRINHLEHALELHEEGGKTRHGILNTKLNHLFKSNDILIEKVNECQQRINENENSIAELKGKLSK